MTLVWPSLPDAGVPAVEAEADASAEPRVALAPTDLEVLVETTKRLIAVRAHSDGAAGGNRCHVMPCWCVVACIARAHSRRQCCGSGLIAPVSEWP